MTDNARLTGMRRRALDRLLVRYLELEHDDQQAFMERTRNRNPRLGRWLALMVDNHHTISVLETSYRKQALASRQEEPEMLAAGYRVGPWRVDSPVGRGGMGMVYRGRRGDDAFQMDVAIKLIGQRRAGLADLDAQAMGEVIRTTLFDQISQPPGSDLPRIALSAELDRALDEVSFTEIALTTLEQHVFQGSMEAIESQFEDQPEIQGKLLQTLVRPMREVGLLELAGQAHYRAIDLRREHLGPLHEDTLHSLYTAGNLEIMNGNIASALELFEEALEGRRQVLGDDDANTLSTLYSIGVARHHLGDLDGAIAYYREALDGRMASLAYFEEALSGRRRVQGERHPLTLYFLSDVGVTLLLLERHEEARPYLEQALSARREILGPDHPHTIFSVRFMGRFHEETGNDQQAESYYRETLNWRLERFGEEHSSTMGSMLELAQVLSKLEQHEEALDWGERAVQAYTDLHGPEDRRTLEAKESLASLQQSAEAEPASLDQ